MKYTTLAATVATVFALTAEANAKFTCPTVDCGAFPFLSLARFECWAFKGIVASICNQLTSKPKLQATNCQPTDTKCIDAEAVAATESVLNSLNSDKATIEQEVENDAENDPDMQAARASTSAK